MLKYVQLLCGSLLVARSAWWLVSFLANGLTLWLGDSPGPHGLGSKEHSLDSCKSKRTKSGELVSQLPARRGAVQSTRSVCTLPRGLIQGPPEDSLNSSQCHVVSERKVLTVPTVWSASGIGPFLWLPPGPSRRGYFSALILAAVVARESSCPAK